MANFYKKSLSTGEEVVQAWADGEKKAGSMRAPGEEMAGEKNFGTRKEKSDVEVVGAKERKVDISWLVRGKKKSSQLGRSMIEMLGVLAIIGVLSIASISAYSQAMFKHQLNQHAESFSLLLNNAISVLPSLSREYGHKGDIVYLGKFFADTSMLPIGMSYSDKTGIVDIFKNRITITYAPSVRSTEYYLTIAIDRDDSKISSRALAICRNVMIAAQQNADNIWGVQMRSESSSAGGTYAAEGFEGGHYTGGGYGRKLATASLNDFDAVCRSCNSQKACYIVLYISVLWNNSL